MDKKRPFEQMLTPQQVAEFFAVDPKTVSRWARNGRLPAMRTPGGHHRFRLADVERFMQQFNGSEQEETATEPDDKPGGARA